MINYTANYTTINVKKHRVGVSSRTRIPRIPTDLCDPVANNHPSNPCQSVFKNFFVPFALMQNGPKKSRPTPSVLPAAV